MPLAEVLKQVEAALVDAKKRAGPIAVATGRFWLAEAELTELRTAPDQSDTQSRAYDLLRSLNAVPREHIPAWVFGAGAVSLACLVVGKVGRVDFRKIGAVVGLGSGAAFLGQQTLAKKPSSEDRLKLDAGASKLKAEEVRRQQEREQDEKDTKELEEEQKKKSEDRARNAAKNEGVPIAGDPDFSPLPNGTFRFGYWKDGQHQDVPLDELVRNTVNGKRGYYSNGGTPTSPKKVFKPLADQGQ